jgi:hypothetical protein
MKVRDKLYAPADLPAGKNTGIHETGGWVSPKAGLGSIGALKSCTPAGIMLYKHRQ